VGITRELTTMGVVEGVEGVVEGVAITTREFA
jgi:hypothetical protein